MIVDFCLCEEYSVNILLMNHHDTIQSEVIIKLSLDLSCLKFWQTEIIAKNEHESLHGEYTSMSKSKITENAIRSSFKELLESKPLDKITVGDISEKCGITRNTFYYHYHDTFDLLEVMLSEETDSIVAQYPELNSLDECFSTIVEFMLVHRKPIMHLYNSDRRRLYEDSIWKICEHAVAIYADTVFTQNDIPAHDREMLINYYACSCFGSILYWIRSGMKEEHVEGMKRVFILQKGLAGLMAENAKKYPE